MYRVQYRVQHRIENGVQYRVQNTELSTVYTECIISRMFYIEDVLYRECSIKMFYHVENILYKDYKLGALSTLPSCFCKELGGSSWAFGPLFSSRSCWTKHNQLSVQIGVNNIFGVKMLNFHILVLLVELPNPTYSVWCWNRSH